MDVPPQEPAHFPRRRWVVLWDPRDQCAVRFPWWLHEWEDTDEGPAAHMRWHRTDVRGWTTGFLFVPSRQCRRDPLLWQHFRTLAPALDAIRTAPDTIAAMESQFG